MSPRRNKAENLEQAQVSFYSFISHNFAGRAKPWYDAQGRCCLRERVLSASVTVSRPFSETQGLTLPNLETAAPSTPANTQPLSILPSSRGCAPDAARDPDPPGLRSLPEELPHHFSSGASHCIISAPPLLWAPRSCLRESRWLSPCPVASGSPWPSRAVSPPAVGLVLRAGPVGPAER